ncbi:hypothetical protein [Chromobacterium alticapitis]|uniref:Uncharacterized protein n=1 Tax=Chromobacterium alticapitis TaxID=2073169 RepID=A0A2S5DDK3_9NEIS|nr:hypothetical protein [Chromobacterium alticapitis]POZ61190.1 hypothetical protein C2I19_15065 [Chromobacterium alticapitis]
MKKHLAALCLLCQILPACAGRLLPDNLVLGTLGDVNEAGAAFTRGDQTLSQRIASLIAIAPQRYPVAAGVRIFDEHNRFLLSGQLNDLNGRAVGVTFDPQGNINRIWVLGDDEIEAQKQRQAQASP